MPEETEFSEHVEDTEEDEAAAFNEEADPDDAEKGLTEEDPEEEAEEEEPGEEEESEEEEDEDLKRGQELQAERARQEEEARKSREEADRRVQEQAARQREEETRSQPISREFASTLKNLIPETVLPDAMEIDGVEVNLKQFAEDYPEASILSSYAAKAVIDTLIRNGYLMSGDAHKSAMGEVETRFANDLFRMRVESQVENASDIWQSEAFQAWFGKEPDKVQELMNSNDYRDHVRVFQRFLKASGQEEADKKKRESEEAARKKKEKHDAIYGSTARGKTRKPAKSSMTPEDEEREAFESEDDE